MKPLRERLASEFIRYLNSRRPGFLTRRQWEVCEARAKPEREQLLIEYRDSVPVDPVPYFRDYDHWLESYFNDWPQLQNLLFQYYQSKASEEYLREDLDRLINTKRNQTTGLVGVFYKSELSGKEKFVDDIKAAFMDAIGRVRHDEAIANAGKEGADLKPGLTVTQIERMPIENEQTEESSNFDPRLYGGVELCLIVSFTKSPGKHDLAKLRRMLSQKAHRPYKGKVQHFKQHVHRQKLRARQKGWFDEIPDNYWTSYGK